MIKSFLITVIIAIAAVYAIICLEKHIISVFSLNPASKNGLKQLLLEPFCDIIKIFSKHEYVQKRRNFLFLAAPIIVFCPVLTAFCLIPFNQAFKLTNFDTSLIIFFALVSISVIGRCLAGFSSENNLSLVGAARVVSKLIASLISIGISILAVSYTAGSLNIDTIIQAQSSTKGLFGWYFLPLFIGAVVFFISALILLNTGKAGFISAENSSLGAYAAEYSGIKLALLEISDYMLLFLFSAIFASVFFGGYLNPFGAYVLPENLHPLEQTFWFLVKIFIIVFCAFLVRTSLPKAKSDKLLELSYKVLLPLSLINLNIAVLILYLAGN